VDLIFFPWDQHFRNDPKSLTNHPSQPVTEV